MPAPTVKPQQIPLVVDLDGTLTKSDLLYESFFSSITRGVVVLLKCLALIFQGRAQLKAFLATAGKVSYELLPYDDDVLAFLQTEYKKGRPVYLATASDTLHAQAIAKHLGCFTGVFSSDGTTNLKSLAKAELLVKNFGSKGFDYIGNDFADIPVWRQAHTAFVANAPTRLLKMLKKQNMAFTPISHKTHGLKVWLKALRVHQYAKNALIFLPLLTSHSFYPSTLGYAILATIAFSLCASSVYLLNDLVDLNSDRQHPTKRRRPFASGALPLHHGMVAAPILFLLALGLSLFLLPLAFTAVLMLYFSLTLAYSLHLKRKLIIDVVVLGLLYTLRVMAGAVAIDVSLSEWLLAFSMFIFTFLAFIKRYVELSMRMAKNLPSPSNRDYKLEDIPIVGAMAAASGFNAITIFSLYVSSPAVASLYSHPHLLWMICPLLLYWMARILILAHRGQIDDDPVLFAIKDRISYCVVALMAIIALAAI